MFAHNRSFELRLKSAEENLSRAASEEQKELRQRRWLVRRTETKHRLGSYSSNSRSSQDQTRAEQNIAKLAQSNKIAVYHSEPKPLVTDLIEADCSNANASVHGCPSQQLYSWGSFGICLA